MFSIGLRGRFGNYDHHELSLARQKQDFGNILTRVRAVRSDETASHLSAADELQDHGSASQTAMESRQAGIPLSRLDESGSPSRQNTSSSADLSGIDRTRELVKLILDADDIKRNLVASEFLELTDAEFQDILDKAAAILRDKETSHDRAHASSLIKRLVACFCSLPAILFVMYCSTLQAVAVNTAATHDRNNNIENENDLFWQTGVMGLMLVLSVNMMQLNGYIHAYDALASRGRKIRELRDQFQEFCASIRESGLRRVCCTDTPCSISKESITRFLTYAGLAGAVVVGTGIIGIAPYHDALNTADFVVQLCNNQLSSRIGTGDSMSQQAQDAVWWFHFSGIYACNLGVPLVFMANVFSGLKQDVMDLIVGNKYKNEHVQDTVHNLRALLARLLRDDNFEKFAEDLIHQKHIGSSELMLMNYASKMELDANALEMRGITQDVLDQHGIERTGLAVLCSEAKQIMDALPAREIAPVEALELINDLRFDVSFRNKVLSGLKFGDATYSDGWVRFVGGARTLARLGLGWLAMNSLSGIFSSRMIVQHYGNKAGVAKNATLVCALFANKTITPFDAIKFHASTASAAAQGIALSNAAMNTLDTGWIMLMMGYSSITTGARILPKLKATTAGGKICELLFAGQRYRTLFSTVVGTFGTAAYVNHISPSCQNNNEVLMLRECPHLSDIPASPITYEYRGSCYASMAYVAATLSLPLIQDWRCCMECIERVAGCLVPVNENTNSNAESEVECQQEDVERQQEESLLTAATTSV